MNSDIMSFLPLILIFVVFYFLLIRPQQKKQKAHQTMLEALRIGDRVITNGGLIGTVVKIVSDNEIQLEIAENTRVRVLRSMLSTVMVKGSPLLEEINKDISPKAQKSLKTVKETKPAVTKAKTKVKAKSKN